MGTVSNLKRPRLYATIALGVLLTFSMGGGLLWLIGFTYEPISNGDLGSRIFQITPNCSKPPSVTIQVDAIKFSKSTIDLTANVDGSLAKTCRSLVIKSDHQFKIVRVLSLGKAKQTKAQISNQDGYTSYESHVLKPGKIIRNENGKFQSTILTGSSPDSFDSINIKIATPDLINPLSFSEGEVRTIYIVENVNESNGKPIFNLVIHPVLRVLETGFSAEVANPRKPNIYTYEPKKYTIEGVALPNYVTSLELLVRSKEREKLKETLLVVFSALFGVGISALFESLLASEIYRALLPDMRSKKKSKKMRASESYIVQIRNIGDSQSSHDDEIIGK